MTNIIVYTTVGNNKEAEKLAKLIIDNNLGACVQLDEVKSYYKWKGKIENSREIKLSIKTCSRKYKGIQNLIINNSKYEIPEIIVVKINKGYDKYLNWMNKNL
jgi:periplasmic divalent cation tolerance protein